MRKYFGQTLAFYRSFFVFRVPTMPLPLPTACDVEQQKPDVSGALLLIARILTQYRYRYGSEQQLHERLADVLSTYQVAYRHEYILDAQNRADFFLEESGLVIEVKVDGSLAQALRQVHRYLKLPQVSGVLLAGTPTWALEGIHELPAYLAGALRMCRLERQAL